MKAKKFDDDFENDGDITHLLDKQKAQRPRHRRKGCLLLAFLLLICFPAYFVFMTSSGHVFIQMPILFLSFPLYMALLFEDAFPITSLCIICAIYFFVIAILLRLMRKIGKRSFRILMPSFVVWASSLVLFAILFWAGVIQLPIALKRTFVQKHDYRVLRDVFRAELPKSLKIRTVWWPGIPLFPAPDGPGPAAYAVEMDSKDFDSLISGLSGFLKPIDDETRLERIIGSLDSELVSKLMAERFDGPKTHDLTGYEIGSPRKLATMLFPSYIAWDKKQTGIKTIYINVNPLYQIETPDKKPVEIRSLSGPVGKAQRTDNPLLASGNERRSFAIDWTRFMGGPATGQSGTAAMDEARDCAVDGDGNLIVTGSTQGNFPVVNAQFPNFSGVLSYGDAFVAKLSPSGVILWSTYLGGATGDSGDGIAVDPAGNIYIAGSGTIPGQESDKEAKCFLAKFTSGGKLLWSTGIGNIDFISGIAMDGSNGIWLLARTDAPGFAAVGGYDNSHNGDYDCILCRLDPEGKIIWSTYLGGRGADFPRAISAIPGGKVCIGGETQSVDFPTSGTNAAKFAGGEADMPNQKETDGFLSVFNASGALIWSTCVGGSANDDVLGVAADLDGNLYATGGTSSKDFPVRAGFDMSQNGGKSFWARDAFVMKFGSDGGILWSTYLGGKEFDDGRAIAAKGSTIAIAGDSTSGDFPIPAWCNSYPGKTDNIMIALFDTGGKYLGSTVMGGKGERQEVGGLSFSLDGNLYMVGECDSAGFPPYGRVLCNKDPGSIDAFITKIMIKEESKSSRSK